MKTTLWITLLAAALVGGQAFAEVTGTTIEEWEHEELMMLYYGKFATDESVSGGDVIIKADPEGVAPVVAGVWGGYAGTGSAIGNTVTMTGGKVALIIGGESFLGGDSSNNEVIVTGGTIVDSLTGGASPMGIVSNNRVHLVGKGVSDVSIANAQGSISKYSYSGGDDGITIGKLRVYWPEDANAGEGNSLDIYGTGISVESITSMQILTFNITDGQITNPASESAISLTSTDSALNLTGVELQVNDIDVQEWTPGTTVTLVQAETAIEGLESGSMVNIKRENQVVALGQLLLDNENKTLSLTVQGSVPEPTTGTLSLLALAGLASRRRRR